MAHEKLRDCQERVANAIVEDIVAHLKSDHEYKERRYGFIGVTGSGKTITTSKIIKRVSKRMDGDVMFVYITLGKGDLDGQVREKMVTYMYRSPSGVRVMDTATACKSSEIENVLIVENWSKLNQTDKDGKPKNAVMKEGESGLSFPQLCEYARTQNIPIVLILDEVHHTAFSDKSLEIRHKQIRPTYTLEVSATPKVVDAWHGSQRISFDDAVKSGLVKKFIRRDTFIATNDGLKLGIARIKDCLPIAEQTKTNFDPRMLVFVPNGETGIEDVLATIKSESGWSEETGEVVIWMSKHKSENYLRCKDNRSNVRVIITKEAIDTGVDIPAVQVIVQLRPTKSRTVEVQKLGRGLRMPEQKHYGNALDSLYFYVFNDHELDFTGVDYLKDHIEKKYSVIKAEFKKAAEKFPSLTISYYERICPLIDAKADEFADVFQPLFIEQLNGFDAPNLDATFTEEVRREGMLHMDEKKVVGEKFLRETLSNDDVDEVYHSRIRTGLKHLTKHHECIKECIESYLDSKIEFSTLRMQIFVLNNFAKITELIAIALHKSEESVGITKKRVDAHYSIPNECWIDGEIDKQYSKFLHDSYFVTRSGRSAIEDRFEKSIDKNKNVVWWMRNYDRQYGDSFSVCYDTIDKEKGVFFPDYIIALTDGRIMIVDTTGGTIDTNKPKKKQALLDAIKPHKSIIGGIIREIDGVTYICHSKEEPFDNFLTGQSEMEFFKMSVDEWRNKR